MPSLDTTIAQRGCAPITPPSPPTRCATPAIGLDQRKRWSHAGVLERVVDGAYAFTGTRRRRAGEVRCSLHAAEPQLVVAGPTAGRLWDLRRSPRDGLVHVIAPPCSHPCREPWVRAYRTAARRSPTRSCARLDGIRVTSPSRTVVDLTRYVGEDSLASVIEDVLNRGLCTVARRCTRTALRLATPGRPWARRFLAVLDRRSPGAPAESDAERRVFEALRPRGVAGLERQVARRPAWLRRGARSTSPSVSCAGRWRSISIPEHNTPERDRPGTTCVTTARDVVGWETRRVGEVELDAALRRDDRPPGRRHRTSPQAALRDAPIAVR